MLRVRWKNRMWGLQCFWFMLGSVFMDFLMYLYLHIDSYVMDFTGMNSILSYVMLGLFLVYCCATEYLTCAVANKNR